MRHFLRDHLEAGVFDPGAVRILIAAFDSAWQSIKASGAKPSDKQVELMRATLAKYIIEQARHGELDQRPQGVGVKKNSRPCRLLPYLALRLVSKHASPAPVTVEDCRIAGFQAGASAKAIRHLGHQHALEDQLDFGGLLDRKIGQLLPLENPARPCDRPNDGLGVRGFHARSGAEATPRRTHRGVSAARPRLAMAETGLRGWGGRTRTSEWRNQNPAISPELSVLILKKERNSTHNPINGLAFYSE